MVLSSGPGSGAGFRQTHSGVRDGSNDLRLDEARMFLTVYTYRARKGYVEATIRLHDELRRNPSWRGPGFITGELLQSLEDPQEFVEVARFEDEHSARETTRKREFSAWYARLLETLELGPSYSHFRIAIEVEMAPAGGHTAPRRPVPGAGGQHGHTRRD